MIEYGKLSTHQVITLSEARLTEFGCDYEPRRVVQTIAFSARRVKPVPRNPFLSFVVHTA